MRADGGDAGPAACTGQRACEKKEVRACRDGKVAELITDCTEAGACSMGRCTSASCAAEESTGKTGAGCLFYSAKIDNVTADANLGASLLVTNSGSEAVLADLQAFDGVDWGLFGEYLIAPHSSTRMEIVTPTVTAVGRSFAGAFRVVSNGPVTVAQIQSDDLDQTSGSTSGTFILPAHLLGVSYRAVTYPQLLQPKIAATGGSRGGAGRVVVVGLVSPTAVTFMPSARALVDPLAPAAMPRTPVQFTLNDGDVFQIYSAEEGDDLTGSEITADGPIAVFSGNISTTYGRAATGINSPDSAHEQMMPVAAWSTRLIAPALPPQAETCDGLLSTPGGPFASMWRILASRDGTEVRFSPGAGAEGLPPDVVTLDAGEVWEGIVSGGSFALTATFPVYVTQGMDCEPSLSPAIGTERLLKDLYFGVLPNFDQALSVIRPRGKAVSLDDMPIHDALFLDAGGGFEIANLPLNACIGSKLICTHHLSGDFGVTMRGMDVLCSYAMTAPIVPACPPLAESCVP